MIERFRVWCLVALIIFLPLSAWLVSLTGQNWVGLGRDLLLAIFILLSLPNWRLPRRPTTTTWLAIAFVLLVLASYFYRQDSIEQWLRGVRYLIEPLLLFIILHIFPLKQPHEKLWGSLAIITIIVAIGAMAETSYPSLFRTTLDSTSRGYLGQIHLADTLTRLQSTLAGPNALGLFLMIALLLLPAWQKTIQLFNYEKDTSRLAAGAGVACLFALLMTYSRSSYLGFFTGALTMLIACRDMWKKNIKLLIVGLTVALVLIGVVFLDKPEELIRTTSNSMRLEQYQRLWEQKDEIGFWGRGAGAAGLVSVDRLDGGPNFYTENSYLDAYEAVGLLAALAYLGFWIFLAWSLLRTQNATAIAVGATVLGLAVAGMFINHYTGQAAIWLALLFAGIAPEKENGTKEGFI
ncbi:MAG: O-antigen ligase family protein [Candidatus Berkelbacteria bacterium]|nr:O-antigen ligase family protein [Candidatus Berkelbacteria bacterium]